MSQPLRFRVKYALRILTPFLYSGLNASGGTMAQWITVVGE